jgi:hypothetical protein
MFFFQDLLFEVNLPLSLTREQTMNVKQSENSNTMFLLPKLSQTRGGTNRQSNYGTSLDFKS